MEDNAYEFWRDVPGMYPKANYEVNVLWGHLERWIDDMRKDYGIRLDPDFQRAHVWTEDQQRAYIEYVLRGGETGQVLYWNSPEWTSFNTGGELELVDGKQRLEAVRKFVRGDLKVFGRTLASPQHIGLLFTFRMRICGLQTRADVLRWYLAINAGGTPHSEEELGRVRALLAKEEEEG